MTTIRRHAWRVVLVVSGVLALNGGRLHPSSEAADPLRQELATMTAHEHWVPGHALTTSATVLLVAGLWLASRLGYPPRVLRALRVATVAFSLYAVETVFHLMSFVDSHALATGGAAPVAMTHLSLASVLYPVSGAALVHLAVALGREWSRPRRLVAALGVVAGTLHALSVPLVLLLPDTEITPVFAGAGVLLSLWTIGLGLSRRPAPAATTTATAPAATRPAAAVA